MFPVRVFAFQTLRVFTSRERTLDLGSPTTRSLFAFLLLNRSQPTDRRQLAFSFWPRATESAARRNLRQYLHRLRQILEDAYPEALLLADQNGVQFNPQIPVWLDIDVFRTKTRPEASLEELQEAVSLYAGDLLEDLYEDWCQEERQILRNAYLSALERISNCLQRNGDYSPAIVYTQKWVAAEPFDEAAHRQLMTLYSLNGERNRAIQHYQTLADLLSNELETDPLPETSALLQAIQSGGIHSHIGLLTAERLNPIAVRPQFTHSAPPQPDVPFVGRRDELKSLQEIHTYAENGQGSFLLVTGESGIGKTRLTEEYYSQHSDLTVLRTLCHEMEARQPFAAVRRLLQQAIELLPPDLIQSRPAWLGSIAQLAPKLQERFPDLQAWPTSPLETWPVADGLCEFFLEIAKSAHSKPLYLTIDDLQWSDGLTWDFLAQLARHLPSNHLVLLGLCRLEDMPVERGRLIRTLERNHLLQVMPLQRLTLDETAQLAAHLLPKREEDDLFLHRLYQETEGNPFFILEIAKAMREPGKSYSLPLETGSKEVNTILPISIQRVIEARLDRLTETSQELLGFASAVGRSFTFSLLEQVSLFKAEDIIDCIEEWLQRDLVQEESYGYNFSHDKIRQVVYAGTSRARRQYFHRKIGEVLEHSIPATDPTTLAHHYARSDQPFKALPYLTKAGEQALQVRSYHEARQFGLQAVSLLGQVAGARQRGERVDISLQLAQAYAFTGDLGRAQEILIETEQVAIALGDENRLGNLFYRLAQLFWLRGQPDIAGDYARRTLRVAEELKDQRLLQAALRMLGRVSIAISTFDDAIAYLRRYTNLDLRQQPPVDLPVVLGYLGVAYTRVGSWQRAFEAAQEGVKLAQTVTNDKPRTDQSLAFARMQLAFVHADHRNWQESRDVLATTGGLPEVSTIGSPAEAAQALSPLGFMLLSLHGYTIAHLGEPEKGVEAIRQALDWAEKADYRVFHYMPRIFLTEALLLSGKAAEAQIEAERSLESSRQAGNRWATGVTLRLLSETLTRQHNPDWTLVESNLIESMQILRRIRARPDLARTYLALRKLYDRAGQIAWAVDCHFRATSIFEELGMHEELHLAQGQAATERKGAVVIPHLNLKGPNV